MKKIKITVALLLTLCVLLNTGGCGAGTLFSKNRETVREIQCTHPATLSGIYPAGGAQVVLCWADYEKEITTVQIVDTDADTVSGEITMDGVWSFKEQTFSDGRLALCNRDKNEWKFLNTALTEIGTLKTENVDGFFSCDGNTYYYLSDHVLCCKDVKSGKMGKVQLSIDLRFFEITAFDNRNDKMAVQFYLSPYSSECGTAILDVTTGQFSMLQENLYQTVFTENGLYLLSFDEKTMGYSLLYGCDDGDFLFADADIFMNDSKELYSIIGAPYLMGIATDTTLYSAETQIAACPLADYGISGEMRSVCFLPDEKLLIGAVYQNGTYRIYSIDPAQLSFTAVADAAHTASPLNVDQKLAQIYRERSAEAPVIETLPDARKYADTLETKYGVCILLSSQCKDAAALCDYAITLTDTMSDDEELSSISMALKCLNQSLSLYPNGFLAQFKNSMGDGGIRFLLVGQIDSNFGAVGCTYERRDWQNIALDIQMTSDLDGIICHEIWHATENEILSRDYSVFTFDKWAALNPKGFSYYENPTEADPSQQRWTLYSSGSEGVYFVDSYGRVNEREDRARIMEFFMTHDDEAKLLIESPAIQKKLKLMCDGIRNNFDTTGWSDVRWERLL